MEYQSHMDINLVSMQMQKNLIPGTANAKFSIQRTILPKKNNKERTFIQPQRSHWISDSFQAAGQAFTASNSPIMCTLNRWLQHPSHCLLHAGSFTRRTNLHAFHTTVLPVTDGSLSRPLRALHNSRPQRAPQQFNNVKLVADLLQSALFQSTQTPPAIGSLRVHRSSTFNQRRLL